MTDNVAIPNWVPMAVAAVVPAMMETAEPNHRPRVMRLATDPRMRRVWSHLTNRHDGQFVQPAKISADLVTAISSLVPAAASNPQHSALIFLFMMTSINAQSPTSDVLPQREVDEIRREGQELAGKLREEAELQYFNEKVLGDRSSRRAEKLDAAADVLDELAAKTGTGDIVVKRDRRNGEAHALAVKIAETCSYVFGSPLYNITATMTSVALNCEIPKERARGWLKSGTRPGGEN
jgi:hypothetical protein